jgi:hypothetical protein
MAAGDWQLAVQHKQIVICTLAFFELRIFIPICGFTILPQAGSLPQ